MSDIREILMKLVQELDNEKPQQEYSPKEAGKVLNREAGTIRDWIRMERVKSVKRGRNVFIPHDEIERLKETHCELLPPNPDKVPPSLKPKYCANESVAA